MTTYTNIQANTQASEPLTTTVVTALDRNLYALFEGDSTATPFAQLQEPAIQTAAINPVKFAPVTAPNSTATGIYTNAAFYDALGIVATRNSTSTATHTTETKYINRAGTYTFYFSSGFRDYGSNSYITKTELRVDGVVRFTHLQTSVESIGFQDQVSLAMTGGEAYEIKNYYVSGSATGSFERVEVSSQCLVMISRNTCISPIALDRGLVSTFDRAGTLTLRLCFLNTDPNDVATRTSFGFQVPTYFILNGATEALVFSENEVFTN